MILGTHILTLALNIYNALKENNCSVVDVLHMSLFKRIVRENLEISCQDKRKLHFSKLVSGKKKAEMTEMK